MGYQRAGMGDGLVPGYTAAQDAMVIWTPSTGFLNTPGTTSGGYQYEPQVTSVYDVPGLLLPAPACVQANAGAFVSPGCVEQALAVQQENFARTAAYNAGTLKLPAGTPPPTPPPPSPVVTSRIAPPPTPPAPAPQSPPAPTVTTAPRGGSQVSNYIAPSTDFLTSDTSIAGFNVPIWGLLAAGAAALFFLGGKH